MATVEIQTAARKVVRENALLRSALNRYGLTDLNIDNYLRGGNIDSPGPMPSTLQAVMGEHKAIAPAPRSDRPEALVETSRKIEIESLSREETDNILQPGTEFDRDTLSSQKTTQPNTLSNTKSLGTDKQRLSSVMEVASDNSSEPGTDDTQNMYNTTACEAAAKIIANMRGHNSSMEILTDLGCSGDTNCVVKNTTIFGVMDR